MNINHAYAAWCLENNEPWEGHIKSSATTVSEDVSPQQQEFLRTYRNLPDAREMGQDIVDRTVEAIRRNFDPPIEGGKYILRLKGDLKVDALPDPRDFEAIDKAIGVDSNLSAATIGPRVKGTFEVVHKDSGKVVKTETVNFGKIPVPVWDRSFVVDGKKRFVMHQWRRRPGVFTRQDEAGELVTEFNVDPATSSRVRSFKIHFDRSGANADFKLRYNSSKSIPMWDVAKLLGAQDKELETTLGKRAATEVLTGATDHRYEQSVRKLYGQVFKTNQRVKREAEELPLVEIEERLRGQFNTSRVDRGITRITLGTASDRVNKNTILASFSRLQEVANGQPADDRESIALKKLYAPADLIAESVGRESSVDKYVKSVSGRLRHLSDSGQDIRPKQLLKGSRFESAIKGKVAGSMVQRTDSGTNPLEAFAQATATTILGEGAIGSEMAIPKDAKLLNPGSVAFLDPVHTPESSRAGVVLHVPIRTKIVRDEASRTDRDMGHSKLVSEMLTPTGRPVDVSPEKTVGKIIGSFDQWEMKGGKLVPRTNSQGLVEGWRDGEIVQVKPEEVDYYLKDSANLFDANSSLAPFGNSIAGGRVGYFNKQTVAAVPLVNPEVPLVQTKLSDTSHTNEQLLAEEAGAVRASFKGTVKEVREAETGARYVDIIPQGKNKAVTVALPKNIMLGGGAPLDSRVRVKPGDKVKPGDLLADSNFTQDGTLALGTNLVTAYLPYNTSTFEDAVVISESAAKKLTSEHLYMEEARGETVRLGTKNWKKVSAMPLPGGVVDKLDDDGVIKVGARIEPGDLYVVGYQSELLADEEKQKAAQRAGLYKSGDRRGLRRFNRFYERRWGHSHAGEVVKVEKIYDRDKKSVIGAKVFIKTQEQAEVGDKIYGRHANKATISEIVPDAEMPRNAQGQHIELAYNPAAVTGRINPSQNFETFLGNIAKAAGRPEVVENFAYDSNWKFVQDKLKAAGIADGQDLFDPRSGRTLKSIGMGNQYILKAKHQVDHKATARGIGNFQEDGRASKGKDGAQSLGELGVYGLLAQDAREFLRDAQLYKGEDRPEVWQALSRGERLPTAQVPGSFKRFQNYLKAAGIDMAHDASQSTFRLKPVTDRDVVGLARSSGRDNIIQDPVKTVKAGSALPEPGGLFDMKATAGRGGEKWSRFELSTRLPNPVYEGAIRDVLGLSRKNFELIVGGVQGVKADDGREIYGAQALEHMLGRVDLGAVKKQAWDLAKNSKKDSERSAGYRTLKTVKMLEHNKLNPVDAFMRKQVLVLPANMRDFKVDQSTGDFIFGDVNYLYRNLGLIDQELQKARQDKLPPKVIAGLEAGLYDQMRELMQTEGSAPLSGADYQGIVGKVTGRRPDTATGREVSDLKQSLLKSTLVQRRQILSGRTVIGPRDDLNIDEVGLPRQQALAIFEPFIEAEWRKMNPGWDRTPTGRQRLKQFRADVATYKNEGAEAATPEIDRVLDRTVKDRYVAIKRDPVLHGKGIQAFKPVLTGEKTLQLNPLVYGGFGADNDGDSCSESVLIGINKIELAPTTVYGSPPERPEEDSMHHDDILTKFAVIHISEMPRIEETKVQISERVTEYDVPSFVRVPAYTPDGMKMLKVAKFSIHNDCEEHVVHFRSGRAVVVSQDHSLAVLDPVTLEVVKSAPRDSAGMCVPRMISLKDEGHPGQSSDLPDGTILAKDEELGWWLGALIGDGWESGGVLNLSHGGSDSEVAIGNRWQSYAETLGRTVSLIEMPHEFEGKEVLSFRRSFRHKPLSDKMNRLIGRGSHGKHLPTGFVGESQAFRRGLLIGLMDTDGSCCWSSPRMVHDKRRNTSYTKKSQFIASYTTKSPRLAREMAVLCATLGIDTITSSHTRKGRTTEYMIYLSSQDVQASREWLLPTHTVKRAALQTLYEQDPCKPSQKSVAPLPAGVSDLLCRSARYLGATKKERETPLHDQWFSWYATLQKWSKRGQVVPLQTAQDIARYLNDNEDERWADDLDDGEVNYLLKWAGLVLSDSVRWDEIVEIERTGRVMTMWDMTVPGSLTFTCANGIVVWDTMAIFAPVTSRANAELRDKLTPQNGLFTIANGALAYGLSHEAILGLNRISRNPRGEKPKAEFKGLNQAREAFLGNKIEVDDLVTIAGRQTTYGRAAIDEVLPDGMDLDGLKNQGTISGSYGVMGLSKGDISGVMTKIAIDNPTGFGKVANELRRLGQEKATLTGTTLLMEDFKPILTKDREKAARTLQAELKAANRIVDPRERQEAVRNAFDKTLTPLNHKGMTIMKGKMVPAEGQRSNVNAEMTFSKARVKPVQLQQVMFGPGAVLDGNGDVVATPVLKSYSEGLNGTGYWATLHGARMGTVSKVIEVQDPGYLTKQVINTAMDQVVTEPDCGTHDGIMMSLGDKGADLEGRFLSKPVRAGSKLFGTESMLTGNSLSLMRQKHSGQVKVRSPMTCEAREGVCQKCVGGLPNGQTLRIGSNFGVKASQALGERSTQLTLSTFHSGGVYEPGSEGGARNLFEEASALLRMPGTMGGNKASIAPIAGKVGKITRNTTRGGYDLTISGSGGSQETVFLPNNRRAPDGSNPMNFFKPGRNIKAGEQLTEGLANPKDLLEVTGDIDEVRGYLVNRLGRLFGDKGVLQRNVEGVVRAVTNTVEVVDPGDTDLLPGERLGLQKARQLQKNHQLSTRPILKGIDVAPREFQEDFLAKMNFNNLRRVLTEGAQVGAETKYHSTHPIPALAYGLEFNRQDVMSPTAPKGGKY